MGQPLFSDHSASWFGRIELDEIGAAEIELMNARTRKLNLRHKPRTHSEQLFKN